MPSLLPTCAPKGLTQPNSPKRIRSHADRCSCLTSVCLSCVAYIGPKSITKRLRKTKIGTEVAYVTSDKYSTFGFKF